MSKTEVNWMWWMDGEKYRRASYSANNLHWIAFSRTTMMNYDGSTNVVLPVQMVIGPSGVKIINIVLSHPIRFVLKTSKIMEFLQQVYENNTYQICTKKSYFWVKLWKVYENNTYHIKKLYLHPVRHHFADLGKGLVVANICLQQKQMENGKCKCK